MLLVRYSRRLLVLARDNTTPRQAGIWVRADTVSGTSDLDRGCPRRSVSVACSTCTGRLYLPGPACTPCIRTRPIVALPNPSNDSPVLYLEPGKRDQTRSPPPQSASTSCHYSLFPLVAHASLFLSRHAPTPLIDDSLWLRPSDPPLGFSMVASPALLPLELDTRGVLLPPGQ